MIGEKKASVAISGRSSHKMTGLHIRLISYYKDVKTKVVPWFSLVIRQNTNRQVATSSEKLVTSVQFLVALATSESQFRALFEISYILMHFAQLSTLKTRRTLMEATV